MKSICPEIDLAIQIAIEQGNSIKEQSEGWSKAKQVFFMDKRLSEDLKNKIHTRAPSLEYWQDNGSPHNQPDEGFFCNECTVGMSFPLPLKIIR